MSLAGRASASVALASSVFIYLSLTSVTSLEAQDDSRLGVRSHLSSFFIFIMARRTYSYFCCITVYYTVIIPEWWGAGVVICLERGADLHMPQLMPLPLTVSCFSQIQIGFTFLVLATRVVPEKEPLNGCVCVCVYLL